MLQFLKNFLNNILGIPNISEDFIKTPWGKVYVKIINSAKSNTPLFILHGGPGLPHNYLYTLHKLYKDRTIIFYDQLGCGLSDRPDNISLWNIERFVEEVKIVVDTLNLKEFHLFGHSWGTMLALDYYLKYPLGIKTLIMASPVFDINLWIKDWNIYRRMLPKQIQEILLKGDKEKNYKSSEYEMAVFKFYRHNVCRMHHWPDYLIEAGKGQGLQSYNTLWGINEFIVTGNLKNYLKSEKLTELKIPVLLTCGKYDGASPNTTEYYNSLIENSKIKVFNESAHMPHLEEEEAYLKELKLFLKDFT